MRDEQPHGKRVGDGFATLGAHQPRLTAATPGGDADYLAMHAVASGRQSGRRGFHQQRDQLVRGLHERGPTLRASIAVLFRGVDEAAVTPADGSPEALLGNLLIRSAIQRSGVTYVNLAPLECEGQAGATARDRAAETPVSRMQWFCCRTSIPPPADAAVAQLGDAGVNVVNLATLPRRRISSESSSRKRRAQAGKLC